MELPKVSLVCPAYHDENNIGPLVRKCIEVLKPQCSEFEIIVVEDGSPDGTGRVADELADEFPEVTALHHERNLGHGAALRTGVEASRHPLIALMDGDGQYEPLDLPAMWARLGEADLVQGRRVVYPNGWKRFWLSYLYNFIVRKAFKVPFRDLGCSIKVFRREVFEKATPESDGIFMQGELVIMAHLSGFKVVEADVRCYPRSSGKSHSMAAGNVLLMARDFRRLMSQVKCVKDD